MPLTLSHPAAVLPLRNIGLPMSALVIASMVPDLPLFLRWSGGYRMMHSLVGIVTLDLLATLLVLTVWNSAVRDALVDTAPEPVRRRLPARARLTRRQWLLAPVAAWVGAATHVVWDDFSHQGRWGVLHVPWLQAEHSGLPGYTWVQYASSVLGLMVVAWAVLGHVRALPEMHPARPRALPKPVLPAVVVGAALCGIVVAATTATAKAHAGIFYGAVAGIAALGLGLVGMCAVWLAMERHGLV